MTELHCPEDCAYLKEARATAGERRARRFLAHLVETGNPELFDAARRLEPLLYLCERAMVGAQRERFLDLTDQEVLEGVQTALQTSETLEKGIIYTHQAQSPRAQAVAESLQRAMDEFKNNLAEHGQGASLPDADMAMCLRLLAEWIKLEMTPNGRTYLHQTALFHPYAENKSGVIVTP